MKQIINNNFARRFCGLAIAASMIIFAAGCSRTETSVNVNVAANTNSPKSNTAAVGNLNNSASTPANSNTAAPSSQASSAEQKANAIAGRWKPADSNENVIFEFTPPKKDGNTFTGMFNFYASNGDRDEPSKYIVSDDKMIKLIQFGKESKIEISVSADGKSMRFINQDGELSNLVKASAAEEAKSDCEVKTDNANLYVTASDKDLKLKKGTPISWTIPDMHQGIIVVKAKVGNEWIQGEIKLDDTTCNDAPDAQPKKK